MTALMSALGRVVRPGMIRRPTEQDPNPEGGLTDALYRAPSFSSSQPEDATSARIMRPEPIAPREQFETNVRAGYPDTERITRPTGRTSPAAGMPSESLPPPPAPPQLREVRSSQPLPQRSVHGQEQGDSNRFVHAAKEFGRTLLLSGLNPMAAAGSFVGTLVNPQGVHDRDYRRDIKRWETGAKPEMEAIKAENQGKVQQAQRDEAYYRAQESHARIGDMRVNRQRQDEDRGIAARDRARDDARLEAQSQHTRAKDAVDFAAETGTTVDPSVVKGTAFEQYAGQKVSRQQRDRVFQISDAETGEQSVYNYDKDERTIIPGVTGRVQREPSNKPGTSDRAGAKMLAQQRVAKEYSGQHVEQLINDYAGGIYSTIAQQAGVTWEDEEAAKAEGAPADEPDFTAMTAEQLLATIANKPKTKGTLIRALRAQARRQAEQIVKRDLDNLEQKYTQDELGGGAEKPPASSRVNRKKKRTGLLDVQ